MILNQPRIGKGLLVLAVLGFSMGLASAGAGSASEDGPAVTYERVNYSTGAMHVYENTTYIALTGEGDGSSEGGGLYGGVGTSAREALPGPVTSIGSRVGGLYEPATANMLNGVFVVAFGAGEYGYGVGEAAPWWVPVELVGVLLSVGALGLVFLNKLTSGVEERGEP